jgi:O-antigen/teichoic acid export membrane protein
MEVNAARSRLRGLTATFGRSGTSRTIVGTAGFNVAIIGTAGLGGIILARTVGPTVRGEYAAITAWLDVAMVIGQCGQPAALCYYVASDPLRARQYVATSRAILLTVGALVVTAGLLLTPTLAGGHPELTEGYRIALAAFAAVIAGCSYLSALQARDLSLWNLVRVSQPLLGLLAFGVLWFMRLLTLRSALTAIAVSLVVQACLSCYCCRRRGLAPGSVDLVTLRPLAAYGVAQLTTLAPATLNSQLGQIVLSQTVPLADLGRYAVALSLMLLPIPLVSAIGNVVFPQLAARGVAAEAPRRLQLIAIVGSAGIAAGLLAPLAAVAYWLIPLIFGPAYRGAVPLLWLMIPGAIFSACGQVAADLLRGRSKLAAVALAQGSAAVVLVTLTVVLLPFTGVKGCAISYTVSYGVALIMLLRSL